MYAIELLVSEHENILRFIKVMRMACLDMMEGKNVDTADFHGFIEFIRSYADKNHHGKEEKILFQEMQQRLGTAAQTLVRNGMLVEHDMGRLYVKQLEDAVTAYEHEKTAESRLDILGSAMAYADLLKRHIEKENDAVYPFAQRGLSTEVLEVIGTQTRKFEEEHVEERLRQMEQLKKFEQKYLSVL